VFVLPNNKEYDAELGYEVDTRQSKFISREASYTLRTGEVGSPWKLRFENTFRKNVIDSFASHKYLKDEIMPTWKQSVGVQYSGITENTYKKLDVEVAMPVTSRDAMSFVKLDAFHT
jgi:hypothetical protein